MARGVGGRVRWQRGAVGAGGLVAWWVVALGRERWSDRDRDRDRDRARHLTSFNP